MAADFPRSSPNHVDVLQANLGNGVVHITNHSSWCWTAKDIEDIFSAPAEEDTSGGSLPTWVPWVIGTVSALLACTVLAMVWMCCGWPCCTCKRRSREPDPLQKLAKTHAHSLAPIPASVNSRDRSTDELATALSSVLHSYRVGNHTRNPAATTSATATSNRSSQYYEPASEVPEYPDCGHRHPESAGHHKCGIGSVRPTSHTRSSTDQASSSAGIHSKVKSVDHHRSVSQQSDSEMDPYGRQRTYRVPVKQSAENSGSSLGLSKKCTEAWIEDSIEARAAMSATRERPLACFEQGSPPEHTSDVSDMSIDGRIGGTGSISLAPPRRPRGLIGAMGSGGMHTHVPSMDSGVRSSSSRRAGLPRHPPAPPQEYFDATGAYFPTASTTSSSPESTSVVSNAATPPSPPRVVEPAWAMSSIEEGLIHDGTKFGWLPEREGLQSPSHSPKIRTPVSPISPGGTAHPRLQQYAAPPATHPILHKSLSQEMLQRHMHSTAKGDNGNDRERD